MRSWLLEWKLQPGLTRTGVDIVCVKVRYCGAWDRAVGKLRWELGGEGASLTLTKPGT